MSFPTETQHKYTIKLSLPAGSVQPSLEEISIEAMKLAEKLGLEYQGIQYRDL